MSVTPNLFDSWGHCQANESLRCFCQVICKLVMHVAQNATCLFILLACISWQPVWIVLS